MNAWWAGLTGRERLLVGLGAAVVLLSVLYLGVWEPLVSRVERLEAQAAGQRSELVWMRQAAGEVRRLRSAQGAPKGTSGASLLTVVDRSARQSGLGDALQRVEPEGSQSVRVWLNDTVFNDLLRWLGGLWDRHGITVSRISVERSEQDGRVNVRATLERSGS